MQPGGTVPPAGVATGGVTDERRPFSLSARTIVLAYVVGAVLWIALSDRATEIMVPNPDARAMVETLKGWGFVVVTAGLLAGLLRRYDADRARQGAELAARERGFRLLAEHARDIIFRWTLDPTPGFEYLSPAAEHVLGYPPSAFRADPGLFARLVHPDDLSLLDLRAASVDAREFVLRVRHADGHWVWLEQRSSLAVDAAGEPVALEGVARDITEQRRIELALERGNRLQRTLSAANQALVHAEGETDLLDAICRAAVEEGGFRFVWVGYCESDAAGTIRPVAHAGHEAGYLAQVAVTWQDGPLSGGPAGRAAREGRVVVSRDLAHDPTMAPWAPAAVARGYASVVALPLHRAAETCGVLVIYADDADAFEPAEVALLEELAADLSYGIEALRTRARGASAEADRLRLATAIEQSAESVIVTDPAGTIEYVNPAFERITGYARDQVVGQNPRILKSGQQTRAFYEAMWRTLTGGQTWVGDFVNRRRDGSLFTEEAVISPVHDPGGTIAGFVAVKRDVTRERDGQVHERARARERALVAQALAALHPQATPEETADAVCRQIVQLPEASVAILLAFEPGGSAVPLGAACADGRDLPRHPLGEARVQHLRTRAVEGPWVESWSAERGQPLSRAFRSLGIGALAYAPIRIDHDVVGLLEVGSTGRDARDRLTERLPALVEFASIGSAVLGPSMSSRARLARTRERVRAIIDETAFHPVFQPIVDLASRAVVGYEALTRFDDGTPPDEQFREAAGVGLEIELETAALRAALQAADALPAAAWINVNVSPAVILAGEPLRSILVRYPWRLVLEVTEHQAITDYAAFREAVAALGPDVRIAVDDAGAGFASLRHIVELRPHFVKIDRSLVAGIDADPARQALLTGLRHFADSQGCSLVAEGIETQGELDAVIALGVRSGQGYLLGRPVPVRVEARTPVEH